MGFHVDVVHFHVVCVLSRRVLYSCRRAHFQCFEYLVSCVGVGQGYFVCIFHVGVHFRVCRSMHFHVGMSIFM